MTKGARNKSSEQTDAVKRFLSSMNMNYEMWHDGTGYDLDALQELSDDLRACAGGKLLQFGYGVFGAERKLRRDVGLRRRFSR